MQTMGDRIVWARALAQVSGSELARLSGLARSHVQLLESGARSTPQTDTALALARVLGVSLDWLVRGIGPEPTADAIREAIAAARARVAPGGEAA
jgi:transcriptional regulator with XRE-family HTH domain